MEYQVFSLFLFFTILLSVTALYIAFKDRRTLWFGTVILLLLLSVGITLMTYLLYIGNNTEKIWISQVIYAFLVIGAVVFLAFVVLFPIILISMFLYNGILVIKKEGLKLSNLLSLGFGLFLTLYLFVSPFLSNIYDSMLYQFAYTTLMVTIFYFLFIMSMYVLSGIFNLVHFSKKKKLAYIVVLGSGLIEDKVPKLLANRIEKGIQLLKYNPSATLIFSGGQGEDETISEAEAMYRYARDKGIPQEKMLIENASTNTYENIMNSYQMMEEKKFAIVTTSYHVFRALLIAKQQNIDCIGFGAKTKWYFTLNALIRELIGYLSISKKNHFIGLTVLLSVVFFIQFILLFFGR